MRKDIEIPVIKDVHIAAVREQNEKYNTLDWNVYIINNTDEPLEMILIVSQGYDDKDMTSHMRHKLELLPAKSYAKVEFVDDSVLRLANFFTVTYFQNNKMFDKRFEFPADTIKEENIVDVPIMAKKGVLAN